MTEVNNIQGDWVDKCFPAENDEVELVETYESIV